MKIDKSKIAQAIAAIVSIAGIIVMIGWIFDIGVLKSILPLWATMKFSTSLCFFLSGIILYNIIKYQRGEKDISLLILSAAILMQLLIMGTMFISMVFGIRLGIEEIFVTEGLGAVKTNVLGIPAVATAFNFILIAVLGLIMLFDVKAMHMYFKIFGIIIVISGLAAVAGYIFNLPVLYYFIADLNSAMAVHTAVLFIIFGLGLYSIGFD